MSEETETEIEFSDGERAAGYLSAAVSDDPPSVALVAHLENELASVKRHMRAEVKSLRRHLRDANRGAESNARVNWMLVEKLNKLRDEVAALTAAKVQLMEACRTVLGAGKLVKDHIGLLERDAGSLKLNELYIAIDELRAAMASAAPLVP